MKGSFDKDDVQMLKDYIMVELIQNDNFVFLSGRTTKGPSMGQITQIEIELRNLS